MPGRGLGALGGDLGKKNVQEAVLADLGRFGQARDAQNGGKMAELGAKMGAQVLAKTPQDSPKTALKTAQDDPRRLQNGPRRPETAPRRFKPGHVSVLELYRKI